MSDVHAPLRGGAWVYGPATARPLRFIKAGRSAPDKWGDVAYWSISIVRVQRHRWTVYVVSDQGDGDRWYKVPGFRSRKAAEEYAKAY